MREQQRPTDAAQQQSVDCVWVLAASPTITPGTDIERLPRPDLIIAADGGSTLADRLGLVPNIVVGDMDSSDPALLARYASEGAELKVYDHNTKWETDTELALMLALEWGPRSIILLGALGGRLDHSLANMLLLTNPALAGVRLTIWDGAQEAWLAITGAWNPIQGDQNDLVTLLPVGQQANGVRTRGLLYPLDGEPLLPGRGRGVSNRIAGDEAAVWLDTGLLIVVVAHLKQT